MLELKDRVVVITGAASGIGRALALRFFAEGCHLALSDLRLESLRALETELKGPQRVSYHALDVSRREDVEAYAAQIHQLHGRVDVVVNNAGVTVIDTVEGTSYADFEWLMSINFWGVVYGSRAFLPYLRQAPAGRLVNISSIFGLIAFPGQAAYNAAKFAVKGFTESLNQELIIEGAAVRAIPVHPGGIATHIADNARFGAPAPWSGSRQEVIQTFNDKLARTSPAQAAEVIVQGLRRHRRRILIGADAHLVDWIQRCLPTLYQSIVCRGHRRLARKTRSESAAVDA